MEKKKKIKKQKQSKEIICFADFETTFHKVETDNSIKDEYHDIIKPTFVPTSSSKVFLAGVKQWGSTYLVSYENLNTFFNNIKKLCFLANKKKAKIYFHNLKYDGSYILKWIWNMGFRQTLKNNKLGHPILNYKKFHLVLSSGKWFKLEFKWYGYHFIFVDMLKLAPATLEAIGNDLGFEKLKNSVDYTKFQINRDHIYPQEWLTYLKRDIDIMEKFFDNFKIKQNGKSTTHKLTIGAVAYENIRLLVKKYTHVFNKEKYNWWWKTYSGGICQLDNRIQGKWISGNIKMIDANSMYPTVMTRPLPTKYKTKHITKMLILSITSIKVKKRYQHINLFPRPVIKNDNQEAKTPNQYIGIHYINNFNIKDINEKEFIWYLWEEEFNLLLKFYDIKYKLVDFEKVYLKDYLKDKIYDLYNDRLKQKANNLKVQEYISKLILNNLYGKTGQNWHQTCTYYGKKEDIDLKYWDIISENVKKVHVIKEEGYTVAKKIDNTYKCKPIYLASYITSQARVILMKKILEIENNGGRFLYCDTDSVAFIDNNIKFNDIGNDLGLWKYENIENGEYFCCLAPKNYRIVDKNGKILKHASAGIKKEFMSKTKNQDYNYKLMSRQSKLKAMDYGFEIQDNIYSFKKYFGVIPDPKLPKELIGT